MVTLEDHIESVDEDMRNSYDVHKRWTLMHENEYVEEVRWEEGNEIVAHVSLKKDGLLWRGFVNRVKNQSWTDHFSCSSKTVIASVTVVVSVVAWDVIA